MHLRTPSHAVCLLLAIVGLNILLGCASISQGTQNAMDKIRASNPVDDYFEDDEDSAVQNAAGQDSDVAQQAEAAPKKGPFFDLPDQWSIVNAAPGSSRYKLKHSAGDNASMVITHTAWEGDKAQRQEALRDAHQAIIGQMPAVYKKKEYREWIDDQDNSRIMTALEGRKSKDSPVMTILGYSVGVEQDNYMVIAAFPSEVSHKADVVFLVESLRPMPAQKPDKQTPASTESKDDADKAPAPEGSEPSSAPSAETP